MKRIILYVYQSLDGCPISADKELDAAINSSHCVLTDEETYLRIFLNHLGWSIQSKDTFVVSDKRINPMEAGRVFPSKADDVRKMKDEGSGVMIAYGEEIGALLLNHELVDEIVVTITPQFVGGDEKALSCGLSDGKPWHIESNDLLANGKAVSYTHLSG